MSAMLGSVQLLMQLHTPINKKQLKQMIFIVPKSTRITHLYRQLKGSVKEPNKFHSYETEKITRKATWQNI